MPAWIQADLALSSDVAIANAAEVESDQAAVLASVPVSDPVLPAATGPLLVQGTITGSGSSGELVVYRSDDMDGALGQLVPRVPVARVPLGADGRFTVNPSMDGWTKGVMSPSGRVSLVLTGTFGPNAFVARVERAWDAASARWTDVDGGTDLAVSIPARLPLEALPASASASKQYIGCTSQTVKAYKVNALVGEAQYSQRFSGGTYALVAKGDVELGVALKAGGGSWQVSGSSSVSKSLAASNEFPLKTDEHRSIYADFEYHDVKTTCSNGFTVSSYTEAKPYAWAGGLWRGPSIAKRFCGGEQAKYRGKVEPNGTFRRDSGKAQQWSGGVTVHGVGLSSRAGYSSSVQQTWKAGKDATYVCGSNGLPSRAARVFTSSSIR
ncbi:MAG: hypothetical protein U0P45_05505 [Acidimicrobiales bacterium]